MDTHAPDPAKPGIPAFAKGDVVPVILSGGSGTRLWPVSRESFPKQFWGLLDHDRSMIVETALRGHRPGFSPPVVICNQEHRFLVAEQLRDAGIVDPSIVLEPIGRNSAPAVTAAALLVAQTDPQAVLWVMPADAAIGDVDKLHEILAHAVAGARAGRIVTLGMTAMAPETGYGYMAVGAPIEGAPGVHDVARFIEKPDAAGAAALLAEGALWNAGMFVFTAETMLEELQIHAPDVLAAVR
ncbi:sugar phosphate nucleotidyltransferase, partial [Acidisphaera sp. L21]|uniref:sugar phosphate nucleotidyltransferase n=1 Tax=Acidisphaera sp. L21 TaxID=1641851 RepID=UPI0020B14835